MSYEALAIATGTPTTSGSYFSGTFGFNFTVNNSITVISLGAYVDPANPWTTSKQVVIYNSNGTVFNAGTTILTSDTVTQIGQMKYKSVTPFTMPPGNYVIGVYGYTSPDGFNLNTTTSGIGTPDSSGNITLTGTGAVNTTGGGIMFPGTAGGEQSAHPYSSPGFQFNSSGPSFTISPNSGNTGNSQSVTATGVGTSWTSGTTFSVSGGTGASISALSVNVGAQTATFTLTNGSAAATLTISDSTDSATAPFTVSAASSLAMGSITLGSVTNTGISLSWSGQASGGTTPYNYKLYRYTAAPFTPPGTGTLLYNGTGTSYTDTSAPVGVPVFYRVLVTDAASNTALSVQSSFFTSQVSEIYTAPLTLGFIGDSITAGAGASSSATDFVNVMTNILQAAFPQKLVTNNNQGVSGTTSSDWVNNTGGANLASVLSSFTSTGVNYIFIMLGTNDAKTAIATSPATYLSNFQSIVNSCKTAGFNKIFVCGSPFIATNTYGTWTESSNNLILQYRTQLQSLVASNAKVVYIDAPQLFEMFMQHQGSYYYDGIHPNDAGHSALAQQRAINFALNQSGSGGSSGSGIGIGIGIGFSGANIGFDNGV